MSFVMGINEIMTLSLKAITVQDGIFLHFYGPEVGRRHGRILYCRSISDTMLPEFLEYEGKQYVVYGDSGYNCIVFLAAPFSGSNLSSAMKAFNTGMAKERVTVEWFVKEIKQYWQLMDLKRKLLLREAPVQ